MVIGSVIARVKWDPFVGVMISTLFLAPLEFF